MFMEALNTGEQGHLTLIWLVALGLLNSVISAFYYVRVLKAMFLREPDRRPVREATPAISWPILAATAVVVLFGLRPGLLLEPMNQIAVPLPVHQRIDLGPGCDPAPGVAVDVPRPLGGRRTRGRRLGQGRLTRRAPTPSHEPRVLDDTDLPMGIVNTLQKCLETPYFFEDKEAPARIPSLMALAADRLDAADNIHKHGSGDADDVTQYSYEAMFACLRALVYARGYREAGLRCLLLACEEFYVKPGLIEPKLLRDFEAAQGRKLKPEESLSSAFAFVKRTIEILQP